jgi:hypothetical protein
MNSTVAMLLFTFWPAIVCDRTAVPSLIPDSLSGIIETVTLQVTYDGFLQARKSQSKKSKPVNPWPASNHGFKSPEVELLFLGIGLVVCICMLIYCIANNIE